VAGIDLDPAVPGFKSMVIKPHPGGEMKKVKASHLTPYGLVKSAWEIRDGKFKLSVQIPVNTTARIYVPASGGEVLLNGEVLDIGNKEAGPGTDYLLVEKGSGSYTFESEYSD
jgi:alpha-L-rhamnosidase